jgi:hypothetical protein
MSVSGGETTYQYDVCLSFAGEQRAYVTTVAQGLQAANVAIFYDEFDQVDLWGKNLYEHLDWIYRRSSRYCILFASSDYARKNWTNHERRSAQARAFEGRSEYLLPVKFDESEIPGLLPTVAYIDGSKTSPEELVQLVLQKLGRLPRQATSARRPWSVPRNDVDRARLLSERPAAWEYLFFGCEILRAMGRLEPLWRDHEIRYINPSAPRIDDEFGYLNDTFDQLGRVVGNLDNVLSRQAQDAAMGPPGTPGNPERITHLAERLVDIYGHLLRVAADLRSARVSQDFARAYWMASYVSDRPLWEMREFFFKFANDLDQVSISLATQPGVRIVLEPTLKVTLDDRVMKDYRAELKRVARRIKWRS